MADHYEFEEEEFSGQFNGGTMLRILQQVKPHWKWVVGFLVTVACGEPLWTRLHASCQAHHRRRHHRGQRRRAARDRHQYGLLMLVQSPPRVRLHLPGRRAGRAGAVRPAQEAVQPPADLSFSYYSKTPVGWIMSRVTSDTERIAQLVTWGFARHDLGVS
jgi:ATP-binding cassette, subfamily B, bacterial